MSVPVLSYSQTGSNRLTFDLSRLISSKLLVQAASGGGKSWAIRQLCEELFGKVPLIILDPEGEFHTLREKYDFVLAAVRGGDIEASPKTAATLARRLVEIGGSCVIDMSEMKPDQQRLFVRRFLEAMLGLPRELWRPLVVVVDEFHLFAPEKGHGEAESLDACADASTRFRKRGFCLVGATTRIAKLHKDVAGNLHNKMIGFNSLDVDIDRAAKELGFSKEGRDTIRRLDPGSFYVYGPAISKEVTLVRTGPVKTTHPEPGMTVAVAAVPPSSKVKAMIKSSLADLPKEAEEEARSIEELRKQVAELTRRAKQAEKGGPREGWVSHETMASQINAAVVAARRGFAMDLRSVRMATDGILEDVTKLSERVVGFHTAVVELEADGKVAVESGAGVSATARASTAGSGSGKSRSESVRAPAPRMASAAPGHSADDYSLPKGERVVLAAIAQHPAGVDREQLTVLTGYRRSSRDTYLQKLRQASRIADQNGKLTATQQGIADLGDFEQLPTGDGLRKYWLGKLPAGEAKVLGVIADAYPEAVHRDWVTQQTNYLRSSRDTYIQKLAARRLIVTESGSMVKASSILFD